VSNFWLSHRKEKSPLTHDLNYRSAGNELHLAVASAGAMKSFHISASSNIQNLHV